MNFVMKRMCQATMALVICVPALTADTFRNSSRVDYRSSGIRKIVSEYQSTFDQNQPRYATSTKATGRSNRVVKIDHGNSPERQNIYLAAAFLAIQMIGIDSSTDFGKSQAGVLNDALWSLVYRPASNNQGPTQRNGATQYQAQARAARGHRSIPSINIWKPRPKDTPRDPKVRVPEPSFASLLAFDALILAVLGLCLRRRGVGLVN